MIRFLIKWLDFFVDMEIDEASGDDLRKLTEIKRHVKQIDQISRNKQYKPAHLQDIRLWR